MLHQAKLPKNLWAKAIQFAVWLKNRASTRALGNITPYECLYGQKPNLANIPEWGQTIWVYKPAGFKLNDRASQARWIGFNANSTHAHRVIGLILNASLSSAISSSFLQPLLLMFCPLAIPL
jgi:hypothetical protein